MNLESWNCPNCKRLFSRKNQSHTCTSITIDNHFLNKPEKIKHLFNIFHDELLKSNPVNFDPISFAINMKTKRKNFGMLFIENERIKVEFFLPKKINDSRIIKTATNNKIWSHIIFMKEISDIDEQLIKWLNESYETNS